MRAARLRSAPECDVFRILITCPFRTYGIYNTAALSIEKRAMINGGRAVSNCHATNQQLSSMLMPDADDGSAENRLRLLRVNVCLVEATRNRPGT